GRAERSRRDRRRERERRDREWIRRRGAAGEREGNEGRGAGGVFVGAAAGLRAGEGERGSVLRRGAVGGVRGGGAAEQRGGAAGRGDLDAGGGAVEGGAAVDAGDGGGAGGVRARAGRAGGAARDAEGELCAGSGDAPDRVDQPGGG